MSNRISNRHEDPDEKKYHSTYKVNTNRILPTNFYLMCVRLIFRPDFDVSDETSLKNIQKYTKDVKRCIKEIMQLINLIQSI